MPEQNMLDFGGDGLPWYSQRLLMAFLKLVIIFVLTGCAANAAGSMPAATVQPSTATVVEPSPQPTHTSAPTSTMAAESMPAVVWVSDALPQSFRDSLVLPGGVQIVEEEAVANLRVDFLREGGPTSAESAAWVYVLVAPFPTVEDSISSIRLRALWTGAPQRKDADRTLLLSAETRSVLEAWGGLGAPAGKSVRVVDADRLLDEAWNTSGTWAIVPFEELAPRWKILQIDGISPVIPGETPYLLELRVGFTEKPVARRSLQQRDGWLALPTNRDLSKLTTLAMTGVTALSRHIAAAMEENGVLYPARDIQPWFDATDLTHISNEVSFYEDCPKPGPLRADMRFCSSPRYIDLLEAAGADVIELTGNHNLDWGAEPYRYTLDLYRQRGWGVYGGGETLPEAMQPLKIENNGNRLAFLGCSPAGPEPVWAADDKPGSAPCDLPWMEQQIAALRAEGYLPIVTLQAVETDTYKPGVAQGMPVFRKLAIAGAVIVSGSQAHVPQTMTFVGESFVHYGLGNLFFDQMEPTRSRQNFIDRHIFYDGRYLGVELLTTMLEDSARPRPMTVLEREAFLEEIFALSDWSEE